MDPNLDQTKTDIEAFVRLLCAGNRQPKRGRFKSRALLEATVGRARATRLIDAGDVVEAEDGSLTIDGWDIWQEGDMSVGERMQRYRAKHSRNMPVTPTVTEPSRERIPASEASRQQGVKALDAATQLTGDARTDLVAVGEALIAELVELTGNDAQEILKRNSMFAPTGGGKPRYLTNLAAAKDKWLERTVQDLRGERDRIKAAKAEADAPRPWQSPEVLDEMERERLKNRARAKVSP